MAVIRRASSTLWTWLAVVFSLLAVGPPLAAQVRADSVPADSLARDTVRVAIPPEAMATDTLPADSLLGGADTLVAVPTLPVFPVPPRIGLSVGRWEWDREALRRLPGFTLLDILGGLPGLTVARPGGFGRPAVLAPWGVGGGRVQLLLDGYEVDPLGSAGVDLQAVSLVDLASVRVERTPAGVRIELRSLASGDPNPVSEVEAATGNPETRVLRALFNRTLGGRSIATASFDLASTEGWGLREPYQQTTAAVRWTYALREWAGLQLEYRHTGVDRESALFPEDAARRDLVLRARAEPQPGLVLETLLGRGTRSPEEADFWTEETGRTQASGRVAYGTSLARVEGSARWRGGGEGRVPAPTLDLAARGSLTPFSMLGVEGEVRRTSGDGLGALEWNAAAHLSPLPALALFGEATGGERLVGLLRADSLLQEVPAATGEGVVVDTLVRPVARLIAGEVRGWRGGAEWRRGGATLGAALLRTDGSPVAPPGALFDVGTGPIAVGGATGWEAFGTLGVPGTGGALRLDGWYTRWTEVGGRPFLAPETGRASLVYHDVHYGGQLEPTIRLDFVRRGSTLVPMATGDDYTRATRPYNLVNFFLHLRILDVRAFLLYENLVTVREEVEYLDRVALGQRLVYGVRWQFRN